MHNREAAHISGRSVLFGLVWLSGLCFGGWIANQVSEHYLLLMRRAATAPVSIIGLLAGAGIPLLCVYFSVIISRPWLIYPVCFFKACSFSLTGFAIRTAFGSAGWLVRLLLQFTDGGALLLLCWFALRHLDGSTNKLKADALLCGACIGCLGWFDYCYVSLLLAAV